MTAGQPARARAAVAFSGGPVAREACCYACEFLRRPPWLPQRRWLHLLAVGAGLSWQFRL